MKNLAIEILTDTIVESRTKEYFREVSSTFKNGDNRSCLVMLYSVVICDLLFKIKTLDEVYNDPKAHDILETIKQLQSNNQRSAEWENKLIELVNEKTGFLEIHEYENIKQLQSHRHLSAHPVLVNDITLFTPSNDQVRSHVRNALEGVLTKPAIFSKNIFIKILEDLEKVKSVLTDDSELRDYMNSKFLNGLSSSLYNDIFKRLWKLTFVIINDKCDTNRGINEKFLNLMYSNRETEIVKYIKDNPKSFSQLPDYEKILDDQYLFDRLFILLFKGGNKLFSALPNEVKIIVRRTIKDEDKYRCYSIFLYSTISDIRKNIEKAIDSKDNPYPKFIEKLNFLDFIEQNFGKELKRKFSLHTYCNSRSFDNAKKYQKILIQPYLESMNVDELEMVVKAIDDNSQIRRLYNNNWFYRDVSKAYKKTTGESIDRDKYINFP